MDCQDAKETLPCSYLHWSRLRNKQQSVSDQNNWFIHIVGLDIEVNCQLRKPHIMDWRVAIVIFLVTVTICQVIGDEDDACDSGAECILSKNCQLYIDNRRKILYSNNDFEEQHLAFASLNK